MNPALHQDLMQAQRHDLMRSAAQRRLLAEVKAARAQQAREAGPATEPRRRVRKLVWRLLPS